MPTILNRKFLYFVKTALCTGIVDTREQFDAGKKFDKLLMGIIRVPAGGRKRILEKNPK
jgi:hypothetical protein